MERSPEAARNAKYARRSLFLSGLGALSLSLWLMKVKSVKLYVREAAGIKKCLCAGVD
jgi:hypothetical protein